MNPELSPSQIEKWVQCPRRWGHIYLEGRREPSTDAAEAGTRVHALLEAYLRDGTEIPRAEVWNGYAIGEIAHDMTQHLPPAGTVPDVEIALALEVAGIKYRGRIDALHYGVVYDHKTTSDLRYAKTDLENNIQALIYGRWLNADGDLQWTTGRTKKGIKSIKTRLPIVKDEIAARFDAVVTPIARQIMSAYAHGDVTLLDKNTDSCTMYRPNGCPFLNHGCNGRKENMTGKPSLMERMRAARAAETIVETSAAALDEVIVDPINAPDVVRTAPAPASEEIPKKARKKSKAEPVVPPLEPFTAGNSKDGAKPLSRSETPLVDCLPVDFFTVDNSPGKVPEPFAADDSSHNLPVPNMTGKPIHLDDSPHNQPIATYPKSNKPIQTLYVDCLPLGNYLNLVHAHTLIAAAHKEVCSDGEVLNYRLVDFAKGGGMLAAQLNHDILKMEGGFDLALNTHTPEGRDVLQTLCALADFVVVGL